MAELYANAFTTTLAEPVQPADVTITVGAAAPAALQGGQFRIAINAELLLVTAGQNTTTWTVTRGVEGTTAAAHWRGHAVAHVLTAAGLALVGSRADIDSQWLAASRAASTPDLVPAAPAITLGAGGAGSVIPSSVWTEAVDDIWGTPTIQTLYRYTGAKVKIAGAGWPDVQYTTFTAPATCIIVSFWTDADKFEFMLKGQAGTYRLRVNGKLVSTAPIAGPPLDGNIYLVLVDFGSAGGREITIETDRQFGGVYVGPTFAVTAPVSAAPTVHAIVLGDSYTESTGADAYYTGYVQSFGRRMGWDVWASGIGGTGYLWAGSGVKFRDRVAADVVAHAPDVVIVAGGINDFANYTGAAIEAEADLLFAAIASGLPTARLIVLSPWIPRGDAWAGEPDACVAALRNAAATAGAEYIDSATIPWLTGTGSVGTEAYDGNSDIFVGADGTHPSQAGHDYLGFRLSGSMA